MTTKTKTTTTAATTTTGGNNFIRSRNRNLRIFLLHCKGPILDPDFWAAHTVIFLVK